MLSSLYVPDAVKSPANAGAAAKATARTNRMNFFICSLLRFQYGLTEDNLWYATDYELPNDGDPSVLHRLAVKLASAQRGCQGDIRHVRIFSMSWIISGFFPQAVKRRAGVTVCGSHSVASASLPVIEDAEVRGPAGARLGSVVDAKRRRGDQVYPGGDPHVRPHRLLDARAQAAHGRGVGDLVLAGLDPQGERVEPPDRVEQDEERPQLGEEADHLGEALGVDDVAADREHLVGPPADGEEARVGPAARAHLPG